MKHHPVKHHPVKHHNLSIGFALIVLVAASAVGAADAPDFNLPTPEGKRINLKKLLKNGPVLLDFWATYCKPCIKAMPKLQELTKNTKIRASPSSGSTRTAPGARPGSDRFSEAEKSAFPSPSTATAV